LHFFGLPRFVLIDFITLAASCFESQTPDVRTVPGWPDRTQAFRNVDLGTPRTVAHPDKVFFTVLPIN
jgi:hypothetical protein